MAFYSFFYKCFNLVWSKAHTADNATWHAQNQPNLAQLSMITLIMTSLQSTSCSQQNTAFKTFAYVSIWTFTKHANTLKFSVFSCVSEFLHRISQCLSTFLLEWNPLDRLDYSRNPRSDIRVCSIPNGQNQHFSVLSNLYEKNTGWYRCNTIIVAQIKSLAWPE